MAAATFRNTTVSCSVFAGGRASVSGLPAARTDFLLAAGATLARARPAGQTRPCTRPSVDRLLSRSTTKASPGARTRWSRAREAPGGPIPAVRGRRETAHLEQRDGAEDRRGLMARCPHELVDGAVTGDESLGDLPSRWSELDQECADGRPSRIR